jgi:hypothetical protein
MEKYKQAYKEQLIQAGINQHRAEQVSAQLTPIELQMISEIWSTWATTWDRLKELA